ncbi:MAG: DUF1877 family protein [Pseudomonadota bacterium]
MSMGGCFVSVGGYRLRKIVIDPTDLHAYFETPADSGGPTGRQTVEQAWHVVQTLLPETVNGDMLEGADLGEMCIYLTPSRVADAHAQLLKRDASALVRHFVDEQDRYQDLYWANVWVEDEATEWLEQMIRDLMQFFAAAASRRDAVIFYVG